jgi:hypothetical protein
VLKIRAFHVNFLPNLTVYIKNTYASTSKQALKSGVKNYFLMNNYTKKILCKDGACPSDKKSGQAVFTTLNRQGLSRQIN